MERNGNAKKSGGPTKRKIGTKKIGIGELVASGSRNSGSKLKGKARV